MGCLKLHTVNNTDLKISWVNKCVRSEKSEKKARSVYLYGFNGQEKDNEVAGNGNHLAFGDYGYDSRLGRRWNIAPQWQRLPGQSPYSVNNNSPIQYTDPDGEFGFLGAAIGAVVGAVAELGSQVVSNVVQGKPAFSEIDWADVAISSGEGALIGVTGGLSLGVTIAIKGGGAVLRSVVDYKGGKLATAGGVLGEKKDLKKVAQDAIGEAVSLGVGALPTEGLVKDVVADQFVKNGIKSQGQFLTGVVVSDLAGGLVSGVQEGIVDGSYNKAADAVTSDSYMKVIQLPEVVVTPDKNGKITPKDEEKVHEHIRTNLDKQSEQ
jgi:hypothetical protein